MREAEKEYYQKKLELERELLQKLEIDKQSLELEQIKLQVKTEISAKRFELLREFQEQNTKLKWEKIQIDWDKNTWFSKLNRIETEQILSKYANSLLILSSPPNIAKDSCLNLFREHDFKVEMHNLEDFLGKYDKSQNGLYPVRSYSDYFTEAISKIDIEQLYSILKCISTYVIYADITAKKITFRTAYWCINGELEFFPNPIEWDWQSTQQELIKVGKSEVESISIIRDLFIEIKKLISVFYIDCYYMYLDPFYQLNFPSLQTELGWGTPENLVKLTNNLQELQQEQQKIYFRHLLTNNLSILSEKSMKNVDKFLDKEEIFDIKRNELLGLLDKADSIVEKLSQTGDFPSISEEVSNQINVTRERCYEGLFSIALIAPFQSGKSTTLNAFADGREVAPRGLGGGGIKTSACLVKVQNPHKSREESVKITWRSKQDLLSRLDEILETTARSISNSETSQRLREISNKEAEAETEEEAKKYREEYFSIIDFTKPEGKTLLEQAVRKELEEYQRSQAKGSETVQDQLDMLRFAMIVLAYYDDPMLEKLKNKTNFEPKDIENYLKFPHNFERRWNKCFNNYSENLTKKEFTLEEVMYAFIEEVTYIVNSENLKKLGVKIIDCPGIFASKYDTSTALQAMQEASAILFLIAGDKQLSQSEIKVLSMLRDVGYGNKVFFSINYRNNPKNQASKNVFTTILAQLKQLDFKGDYQLEPLYFNAFLALRAMQGEKLLNNALDFNTKESIKLDAQAMDEVDEENGEDIKSPSVEKAWLSTVEQVIYNVAKTKFRELSSEIDAKTVKLVRQESQWDSATEKIKEYVFKTKAWSVLVDLGCEPVINTLEKSEYTLKLAEGNVEKNLEQVEQEWDEARQKLVLFKKESEKLLEFFIDDNWEIVLTQSFWEEVYLPSIKKTGRLAARLIADEATIKNTLLDIPDQIKNKFTKGINWFKNKVTPNNQEVDLILVQTLSDRCAKIIQDKFEYLINLKSQGWFNSLKKGGNEDYERLVFRRVVEGCNLIKEKWTELKLDFDSYLQGLDVSLPEFSGDIRQDMERYNYDAINKAVDQATGKPMKDMLILMQILSGSVVFSSTVSSVLLFDFLLPGAALLSLVIVVVSTIIAKSLRKREEYIKEIENTITEELNKVTSSEEVNIKESLKKKLKIVRDYYSGAIQQSFNNMEEQLEERIQDAKTQFDQTQEERKQLAEVAKNFRENEFQPLQTQMKNFQSSVEKIWQKPS
ncbi:dynamin family protein [Dapis sp. BLCC M229]